MGAIGIGEAPAAYYRAAERCGQVGNEEVMAAIRIGEARRKERNRKKM